MPFGQFNAVVISVSQNCPLTKVITYQLQEKLPVQRLAQRLADGDDDQHAADDDARDQRIERPEERLVDLEREIEQKLNEHGQRTA